MKIRTLAAVLAGSGPRRAPRPRIADESVDSTIARKGSAPARRGQRVAHPRGRSGAVVQAQQASCNVSACARP